MMRRRTGWRALATTAALTVAVALLAACGGGSGSGQASGKATGASEASPAGDIPDAQTFVTFSSPDGTFSLKVPEGWSRTQTGTEAVFTDKLNSVRLDVTNAPATPTAASVTAVEVPAIEAASRGFKLGTVSTVNRAAGDAVLIKYQAESPADPVTGKSLPLAIERYEFAKGGRQVTITVSAPVGSDNVDPWKTVTDSFSWQP